jgi:3-hydroxyisobutyrate dehydrogenase
MNVAFVGLGNMGRPMAANLAAKGASVFGFDAAGITANGVERATSVGHAVRDADIVVTMLPNGEILKSVYLELLASLPGRATLIDCSTVDLESARAAHRLAADWGHLSLDAPVSGGVGGAEAGTLTFMVGGAATALEAGRPALEAMGRNIVHCGPAGAGQAAKICNNMILGISMIAVCEAFNLADKLGLERAKLFEVVSNSSGACWSMNTYCPVPGVGPTTPADNNYLPGFSSGLMLKDLALSQFAASQVEVATPLGRMAMELYSAFIKNGGGARDFSAILQHLNSLHREA